MKLNVSKEWCANAAKIEGDSEVGAGCPDTESNEMLRQQRDHVDSLHRQLLQTKNDLQAENTQLCKEVESALARVKELEVSLADMTNARNLYKSDFDKSANELRETRAQIHTLVECRKALVDARPFMPGSYHPAILNIDKAIAQIDHALSQIQEVKP